MEKQSVFIDDEISFFISPEFMLPEYQANIGMMINSEELENEFLPPPPNNEDIMRFDFSDTSIDLNNDNLCIETVHETMPVPIQENWSLTNFNVETTTAADISSNLSHDNLDTESVHETTTVTAHETGTLTNDNVSVHGGKKSFQCTVCKELLSLKPEK